jgi:hypothetical protein
MKNGHQVGFDILNFKILFIFIFNYIKVFDFALTIY